MMEIIRANGVNERPFLKKLENRAAETDGRILDTVREILKDVCENGDKALRKYGERFDGGYPEKTEISRDELERAFEAVDEPFRDALIRAASNIRKYHEKQVLSGYEVSEKSGVVLGQVVRGLDRVGLYVPGGTAAYPSTVLMNGIPAKLAGVGELVMATPPVRLGGAAGNGVVGESNGFGANGGVLDRNGLGDNGGVGDPKIFGANNDILAAAFLAGVDRVFLGGGAQMVAALAYGTETVPKVDKIVGPGNIYVATAKRLLYGQVDIDMIAGPSEILVMADASADPEFIAADMLSQAEHDRNSAAILLTTEEGLAARVDRAVEEQAAKLGRSEIILDSLKNYGAIIVCEHRSQMIELANRIAPEHLEILMDEPLALVSSIRNAGSVFCGAYAPEPLGDYYSGTNHVLPTSGTARFASPLGVYDFVKRMSYTYYSKEALGLAAADIALIAEREGLSAHAEAVRRRFAAD